MLIIFEIAKPMRWKPRIENYWWIKRFIWGVFSVSCIPYSLTMFTRLIREDERERVIKEAKSVVAATDGDG